MRMYVLPHSAELQADEDSLAECALVALVVGTRPDCSVRRARRFIIDNYNISGNDFSIHRYQPEDFLLIFHDNAIHESILHASPPPSGTSLNLRFKRWQRFSTAEADFMYFRVLVELRGLPSHAWSAAAAWEVLGDFYACPEPTPATRARFDLRRFHVVT